MAERIGAFAVILRNDAREDDAQEIAHAPKMVKGVISVEPIAADLALQIAETRVRAATRESVGKFFQDFLKGA